ncbi:Trypsin-1 [Eumeta japonica]|uniref:Trypsin-1 n=1 Tax=Eumeta variegata TaxID=151549 RepID=A0A4C1SW84_EUMVA|nr:Trypsin-1 [Eumeta japonica]
MVMPSARDYPMGVFLSRHLGIGGHVKFTARTATSKGVSGRRGKRTGLMTFNGRGVISWESRKQRIVALSGMEAEYIPMAEIRKESMNLRVLLSEVTNQDVCPNTLYDDSLSAQKRILNNAIDRKNLRSNSHYVGVVGGVSTSIKEFPYLVSIWKNGVLHCGGTIVTRQYILTAAHCVRDESSFVYSVLVGTSDLESGGERYNVKTIVKHSKYKSGRDYDIGLLEIDGTLSFNDKVAPAQLPDKAIKFTEGTFFNITGWGDTEWGGSQSRTLLRTLVPWVSGTTCRQEYTGTTKITIRMLCAGSEGHDACQGDSGGPLTLNGLVVGVTSGVHNSMTRTFEKATHARRAAAGGGAARDPIKRIDQLADGVMISNEIDG